MMRRIVVFTFLITLLKEIWLMPTLDELIQIVEIYAQDDNKEKSLHDFTVAWVR